MGYNVFAHHSTLPRAAGDQQLLFHQQVFGDDRLGAAGAHQSCEGYNQVYEKHQQVSHD